jgi:hypothetical protein
VDNDYLRTTVEAALRQSLRMQQWILDSCSDLGCARAHIQPPKRRDELGSARNPYTIWSTDGSPRLLASYYLSVGGSGVELTVVEGRRADGRFWTLPEFVPAYRRVLQVARKASS